MLTSPRIIHLSDVFKFTQGLGQKGHQIGRKTGDAIELITLGMIYRDPDLVDFLVIEDGVEGATTAKHKVEFSFYDLNQDQQPSLCSEDLFGIIECKKVGVEQTVKQNFKKWKAQAPNQSAFSDTDGYTFTISPGATDFKWLISLRSELNDQGNLRVKTTKKSASAADIVESFAFDCPTGSQVLIALDTHNQLHVLGPLEPLSSIEHSLKKCVIFQIKTLENGLIKTVHVNESLAGPQTPEKAKQASFVSLDVRKKVLGKFDKSDDQSFISILVIGEAGHWEAKSRSMIKLCNDFNLLVPDKVLVHLFTRFSEAFGDDYQDLITKTSYRDNPLVSALVSEIIDHFDKKILTDMETGQFVQFNHAVVAGSQRLVVREITVP